jgi:hypothetical protein
MRTNIWVGGGNLCLHQHSRVGRMLCKIPI